MNRTPVLAAFFLLALALVPQHRTEAGDVGPVPGVHTLRADDGLLQRASDGGFSWLIQLVEWREVEPAPGEFFWEYTDWLVRAAEYYGLELVLRLDHPPAPVLVRRLTRYAHHGWRYLAFGSDDRLYVSLGAPCNVCDPGEFGAIWSMRPDGSDFRPYARGIRNSVGMTFAPDSGELWFTDWLGDDLPPDELNHAPRAGMHFGFPYCHGGDIPDPDLGRGHDCSEFTPPVQRLGPHVASLGLRFYTGGQFPPGYRGQLLLAEHGSWNRSTPIGYRVSLVRLVNGRARSYQPLVTGWLTEDGRVRGRPVDLQVLPDGSVLISDDAAGRLYRLSYGDK